MKAQTVIDIDDLVGHQFVFIKVDWIDPIGFTNEFIVFLSSEVGLDDIDMNQVGDSV